MDANQKGLVQIYTGDGKGKTTASVGLICRASGCGKKILLVQFLKGRDTGELAPLRSLGVEVLRGDVKKFFSQMTPQERADCAARQEKLFEAGCARAAEFDLLVFDEIFGALSHGIIGPARLCEFIRSKPAQTELVLTGRNPPDTVAELADYVSEIRCGKHPFQKGIAARRGIEF